MRDRNIGFLPVCDSSGAVIGTVTDRDLALRVVAQQLPSTTAVGDIMTRETVACRSTDDLEYAKELMAKHHKSRIMCLDEGGHLAGVISLSDLARGSDAGSTLKRVTEREAHA
jgi:CBS domain-containing protein